MRLSPGLNRLVLALAALMGMLPGCALSPVDLPDGRRIAVTSDAFRDYAEQVFRRQNRALDELIELQQAVDGDQYFQPEQDIVEACSDLNRLAALRRDGRAAGIGLKRRLPRTVVACDNTVSRVEQLLAPAS